MISGSNAAKCIFMLVLNAALIKELKSRIIGGKRVDIKDFPFQLAVIVKGDQGRNVLRGGAVLISKYWALTAAHVVLIQENLFTNGMVYLRGNCSERLAATCNDHKVKQRDPHEGHLNKWSRYKYDIVLVEVVEPFIGVHEKPIAIAGSKHWVKPGSKLTVSGWGEAEDTWLVVFLRAAELTWYSQQKCKQAYSDRGYENMFLEPIVMCAMEAKRDSCYGDSGGPLVHNNVLMGTVITGVEKCGTLPGIYTNLSYHSDWLLKRAEKHKLSDIRIVH